MANPPDVEQIDALLEKNRALVARERERLNELKAQNEDTLQEICTSLIVPASAFGMSYARECLGEKASIAGIRIDAGIGLIMKLVAACFGLSASKGGHRVGKFFHDIANGAFASWTAALGAEYGAKKRLEEPVPALQSTAGAVVFAHRTPIPMSGPMTHEDLAAITAAMSTPATPVPTPNVGAVGPVQGTQTPVSMPMDYGHLAAITAAMLTPPPMPQQRPPVPAQPSAPQPAPSATTAASPPTPPTAPTPTYDAIPKKPYRFAQSREAPLPDLTAAFACGTIPMREVDKNLQWRSQRYNSENLASILNWAAAPT